MRSSQQQQRAAHSRERRRGEEEEESKDDDDGTTTNTFQALLFATQGLDLAIPSRLSYITLDNLNSCNKAKKTGRCDSKLDPMALGQDIFLTCPKHHLDAQISFDESSPNGVRVLLNGELIDGSLLEEKGVELWLGHEEVTSAETACMKATVDDADGGNGMPKVSCATRVLPNYSSVSSEFANPTKNNKVLLAR